MFRGHHHAHPEEAIPLMDAPGGPLGEKQQSGGNSSAKIWSLCLSHADKFDKALVESWKGDMDGILIFSGLFSAIVTAFLIDSYKTLQGPDAAATNVNLTMTLVTLFAQSTNQKLPVLPQFTPNSQNAYLVINALWFLSLFFSLMCALAATLVQQWSRMYLQGIEERFDPHQRARMRTYLQQGVQKFYLSELVGAIPLLIHVALFLFLAGLLVFLFNLDTRLAYILLCLVVPALVVYVLLTILPVFYPDCPYKTPLTTILSYIKYTIADSSPKPQHHDGRAAHNQPHPESHSEYLTTRWNKGGNAQGPQLDHTALRWTLLALTDNKDLEEFIGALPGLLQSDTGRSLTPDGALAAQALLFSQDMLAAHLVRLLHSAVPLELLAAADRRQLDALTPAQGDRMRLDKRAVTCLSIIALLSRACNGPVLDAPQHWSKWTITYFNPVVRDALALRAHTTSPTVAALARSTVLLLTWRGLVAYRAFLWDVWTRAANPAAGPDSLRLTQGNFLARALSDVLRGLPENEDDVSGTILGEIREALLPGVLNAYMQNAYPRGLGGGGAGAGAGDGLRDAVQADLGMAKRCLAVLFMHAACVLPADEVGKDTLRALAAPLGWSEPCDYDDPERAKSLLDHLCEGHGLEPLTQSDADRVIQLYCSIHDPNRPRAEHPDAGAGGGPGDFVVPRRVGVRQSTA